jgi:lipopolysaccharide/colanic/teichoic acid biosynthesis glycosyltransferase
LEQTARERALVHVPAVPRPGYALVKRVLDIAVSGFSLVVLSPLLLLAGLAIFIDSGLPILYSGERVGLSGRQIRVHKFRSMRDGSHHHLEELLTADEELRLEYGERRKLREDPRRTRVGAMLRRTSLDELPQLLNVLVGEMSLVGPRPYFPREMTERPEAVEILAVRPGITGLWQVNGRSDRTFEERLAYDLEYVQARSLWLDVRIMFRTIGAVISGRGAY